MANIDAIVKQCDAWLSPHLFKDYCPNGLQVAGQQEIQHLALAVTADRATIERAIEENAQALLVHHGLFWHGQPTVVTGMMKNRLALALAHDLNIIAYHLPLDAHVELGNNKALADQLGFEITGPLIGHKPAIGMIGRLPTPMAITPWVQALSQCMGQEACWLKGGPDVIQTVAWCSGAAQDAMKDAHAMGADAYLSGEVSERSYYEAKELGIHYIALGHHATEKGGVQKLGAALAENFDLHITFIDSDNPI